MKSLVGGLLVPYFPELVTKAEQMEPGPARKLAAQFDQAVHLLKRRNPQTIVLLAPNGAVIEDAIGLYVHPRLKGALAKFQMPDMAIGFETDNLLMKLIAQQSRRLGVHMEELTDDLMEERRLNAQLSDEALVALYYLQRAGFKGQLVNLSYGALPYEELYTLGKAVRLAAERSSKSTAVVVAAAPPFSLNRASGEMGRTFDKQLLRAVERLDVKSLLEMEKQSLELVGEKQLRPFFFLLGTLTGTEYKERAVCFQEVNERVQAVGKFFEQSDE